MSDDKNNLGLPAHYTKAASSENTTTIGDKAYLRGVSAINTLARMTGMDDVVKQVSKIIASHLVASSIGYMGHKKNRPSRHMIFEGNPGTGKTTVARLMGDVFHGAGLLEKGHVVEAKGSDLIGEYIGHTGPKIKKLCDAAVGGILFIDEAYSLASERGDEFREEAVTELVSLMEQDREDYIAILAGYPDEMKGLLKSNPGLQSRIPYSVNFRDYNKMELERIFRGMAVERGMVFEQDVVSRIIGHLEDQKCKPERPFANGREVRNIVQYMADQANLDVFGDYKGINTLRQMMAIAAGSADVPDVVKIFVTHRNFDCYLQENDVDPVHQKMGFDLSPRSP